MVSASRTALENLITLTPVCRVRRTRQAVESPEETQTLLNSPCGEQSSAKYFSKGFPACSPQPALCGRRFGDRDQVDYVQRVKRKGEKNLHILDPVSKMDWHPPYSVNGETKRTNLVNLDFRKCSSSLANKNSVRFKSSRLLTPQFFFFLYQGDLHTCAFLPAPPEP